MSVPSNSPNLEGTVNLNIILGLTNLYLLWVWVTIMCIKFIVISKETDSNGKCVTYKGKHQTFLKDLLLFRVDKKPWLPLQDLPAHRFLSLFPFKKKPSQLFVNRESIVQGRMCFPLSGHIRQNGKWRISFANYEKIEFVSLGASDTCYRRFIDSARAASF